MPTVYHAREANYVADGFVWLGKAGYPNGDGHVDCVRGALQMFTQHHLCINLADIRLK